MVAPIPVDRESIKAMGFHLFEHIAPELRNWNSPKTKVFNTLLISSFGKSVITSSAILNISTCTQNVDEVTAQI